MAVLHQVDLRTLANQTIGAAGAYTINGLTWWAKGTVTPPGATMSTSIVNGSGLRFKVLTNSVNGVGTNGDLTVRHIVLPLANIPGWTSSMSYMIRARFNYAGAMNLNAPLVGVVNTTSDAANLLAAQRTGDFMVGPQPDAVSNNQVSLKLGSAGVTSAVGRAGTIANNVCVVGLYHFTPRFASPGSELLASGMPTSPSSWLAVQSLAVQDYNGLRTNPCLFVGHNGGNTSVDFCLEQLRIETVGDLLDSSPPTVTKISPTGSDVQRREPIVFQVADDTDLRQVYIWVKYPTGDTEVIYAPISSTASEFTAGFKESSVSGTNPRTFTVLRAHGWPYPPTIYVQPVDGGGNIAV